MLNAARRCRGIATLAILGISLSTATPRAHAASEFEHFVFGMSIADNMFARPTGPGYGELRQQFFAKIESARRAVRQCGGCAGAQAQLDALLAEEDQFQRMAGRIMGMTGQPPAMARLLGIAEAAENMRAENERLRALISAWAKHYRYSADVWKREPVNAALLAEAEHKERKE